MPIPVHGLARTYCFWRNLDEVNSEYTKTTFCLAMQSVAIMPILKCLKKILSFDSYTKAFLKADFLKSYGTATLPKYTLPKYYMSWPMLGELPESINPWSPATSAFPKHNSCGVSDRGLPPHYLEIPGIQNFVTPSKLVVTPLGVTSLILRILVLDKNRGGRMQGEFKHSSISGCWRQQNAQHCDIRAHTNIVDDKGELETLVLISAAI